MSAELLSSLGAMALALAAAYLPGFSTWFQSLSGEVKRLLMAGLLAAIAGAAFGLACAGGGWAAGLGLELACDAPGAWGLARAYLAALLANQATYSLAVRPRPDDRGASQ